MLNKVMWYILGQLSSLQVSGCWPLASGSWSLVTSHWLLVSGSASSKKPKTKPFFVNYL